MSNYPPPPTYQQSITHADPTSITPVEQVDTDDKSYPKHYPTTITSQPSTSQPPRELTELEKMYRKIDDRLIWDFEKVTCLPGQPSGLDEGVEDQVPSELSAKGITQDQWREWIVELREAQKSHPTICGCLLMFCFPGGLAQSILCAMLCPISGQHPLTCLPCCYGDWYEGLRKWTDKVNAVLHAHDMHAKLLTYKPHGQAPRSRNYGTRVTGKDHNYEMSFLAIAVTKDESLKLQSESWDHGVNDGCCSGQGRILWKRLV